MRQITRSLYQISLGAVNVFVLEDKGLTLIDPGNPGSADKIFSAIKKGAKTRWTSKISSSRTAAPTTRAARRS